MKNFCKIILILSFIFFLPSLSRAGFNDNVLKPLPDTRPNVESNVEFSGNPLVGAPRNNLSEEQTEESQRLTEDQDVNKENSLLVKVFVFMVILVSVVVLVFRMYKKK